MADITPSNGTVSLVKWVASAIVVVILVAWLNPFVTVDPGERGVVIRLGAVEDRILGEGLHFRIPIVEKVMAIDVKTHKIEVVAPSYSKDLQNVDTKIALNYHLDPLNVNRLIQTIGIDYESRIISPAIQESVKAATANFTAAELVSERPKVKEEIKASLVSRLHPSFITVDDFSIVDFEFAESFERAIDEKQIAEQNALKAQNDLRRIEIEAAQRIAQAKAEAEAIRIQTEALQQNQNLVRLEAVKKWNGQLPTVMLGNSAPFVDVGKFIENAH
jgi:regulator of protease activity HflC (stomatin/prohibitin superfamily)